VLSRSLSARSADVARGGVLMGGVLYLAVGLLPIALGLLGSGLLPGLANPEQVLPGLASQHLSTAAFALFLGALVSAILSTVNSTLLVAASLLSRNLLLAGRADVAQRGRVQWARLGVAGMGVLAWILALQAESVFGLIEDASGFGSAGIVVATSFGLFTRLGGAPGAAASMGSGVAAWGLGYLGLPYPFLFSLGAALLAYLALAAWRPARRTGQPIRG
jgi:Na+/proline symporter